MSNFKIEIGLDVECKIVLTVRSSNIMDFCLIANGDTEIELTPLGIRELIDCLVLMHKRMLNE